MDGPAHLREDLLLARFQAKGLARLVQAAIPEKELRALAPGLGLGALPGKRLKTMTAAEHALVLAKGALEVEKVRRAVLAAIEPRLPAPIDMHGRAPTESDANVWLAQREETPLEGRLAALLALLPHAQFEEPIRQALEAGFLNAREPEARPEADAPAPEQREAAHRIERLEHQLQAEKKAGEDRERALRQRIDQLQHELADLQQRLGKKSREHDELQVNYERAKADLEIAFRRAARFKQSLDGVKAPSAREAELAERLQKELQRAEIEASKVEILEYQLDILEQEDEPRGEARVQAHEFDPTSDRVRRYAEKHGSPPRVLIVGGAGKQRKHRERDFEELKSRLGIVGEWRFADYSSWHRELPRLKNDIRERFDLVFVLHWNRTTFVQKMHDEARTLNGRVRTVPYRGFLSLDRAVTEEVDRFVQERT